MTLIYSGFHAPKIKVSSFSSYSTAKTGRCNTDSKRWHCCCRLSNKFCKCRLFSLHCGGSGNFASQNCHFPWRELERTQCMIPSLGTTACLHGISSGSSILAQLTVVANRRTDKHTRHGTSVTIGPHLVVCILWFALQCSLSDTYP